MESVDFTKLSKDLAIASGYIEAKISELDAKTKMIPAAIHTIQENYETLMIYRDALVKIEMIAFKKGDTKMVALVSDALAKKVIE